MQSRQQLLPGSHSDSRRGNALQRDPVLLQRDAEPQGRAVGDAEPHATAMAPSTADASSIRSQARHPRSESLAL